MGDPLAVLLRVPERGDEPPHLEGPGHAPEHAWHQFQAWASAPSNRMIGETEDFAAILRRFVARPHVVGGVVHDARIAALCIAHGVEALLTRDRDFSLFPELRTRDPFSTGR